MTQEERTLATVSHGISAAAMVFSAGTLGWLVPLVIFLTKRHESRFIAFHALQSVFLHGALFIAGIILGILGFVTCGLGWAAIPVVALAAIVFEVLAAVRANEGKWYAIPVAGEYVRRALGDP